MTKIAGSIDRCLDRNDNGRIETSAGVNALDYGADECVLWTVAVGPANTLLRGLAVDLGDSRFPHGYPWVGGYNAQTVWKLNPETGAVLETVNVGVRPHGMVVASDGMMYIGTLGEGRVQGVNTQTNGTGPVIQNPADLRVGENGSYGIAIDLYGRIWMAGWTSEDAIAFDPSDNSWCRMVLPFGMTVGRGITMDVEGRIWAAVGADGDSHVAYWHVDDCQGGQSVAVPAEQLVALPDLEGPTAVGSDPRGNIWVMHYLSRAMAKVIPNENMRVETFEGTNRVYSFSDSTVCSVG